MGAGRKEEMKKERKQRKDGTGCGLFEKVL
jgi:hypothetical protein